MKLCPRCRFENDDLRKKCASCGKALGSGSPGPPPPTGVQRASSDAPQLTRLTPADRQRVTSLLREARKIEAIKFYRDTTGLGLKESKQAVETFARQSGIEMPSGGGGVGVILVVLLVIGFVVFVMLGG